MKTVVIQTVVTLFLGVIVFVTLCWCEIVHLLTGVLEMCGRF